METISFVRNKSVIFSTKYAWVSCLVMLTLAICLRVDIWLVENDVVIFEQARVAVWERMPLWVWEWAEEWAEEEEEEDDWEDEEW
jgi:hypothetical protein